MNNEKINALDWVRKEYVTPIELESFKGLNSNVAVVLGEVRENKFERYTERLLSIQMVESKRLKWLKLRASVIREFIRAYGEFVEDWRGKTIRLIVEESKGYEVIGIKIAQWFAIFIVGSMNKDFTVIRERKQRLTIGVN